jgi:hypothetical protein
VRRQGPPTYGKRYVGNKDKKDVHDLDNEKTDPNESQIDEIITADHVRIFSPDTLARALKYDKTLNSIA